MNSNRDLLKEAIADAQAVKETAIANAKVALEEAFTPHLKELFASKLEEMELENEDKEMSELDEAKDEDKSEEVVKEETSDNDELDIESLLAELEDEKFDEEDEEGEKESKDEESEDEEESEDNELDMSKMSEDELKAFVEDVIKDMINSGELDSGENEEASAEEEVDINELLSEIEEEQEEISELTGLDVVGDITSAQAIGAIIGAIALVTGTAASVYSDEIKAAAKKGKDALQSKLKDILAKVKPVKEEEMTSTIENLTKEINETKLMNAKLLYVNKMFKAKNLSNNQKVKVIETFDKAESINEAKLIYETLVESIKEKAPINESIRGLASKASGISTKTSNNIIEPNPMFERMRRLAGLK